MVTRILGLRIYVLLFVNDVVFRYVIVSYDFSLPAEESGASNWLRDPSPTPNDG